MHKAPSIKNHKSSIKKNVTKQKNTTRQPSKGRSCTIMTKTNSLKSQNNKLTQKPHRITLTCTTHAATTTTTTTHLFTPSLLQPVSNSVSFSTMPTYDTLKPGQLRGVSTHPAVLKRRQLYQESLNNNSNNNDNNNITTDTTNTQPLTPLIDFTQPVSIGTNGKDYPPFVFVLGGPGSGKGHHCERLVNAAMNKTHHGLPDKIYHINVGGVLRKAQFAYRDIVNAIAEYDTNSNNSQQQQQKQQQRPQIPPDLAKAGPVLEDMMSTGQILPSWVTITLLRHELDQIMSEVDKMKQFNPKYTANVIIDGFPRNIENLSKFEEIIAIPSRLIVMDVPTEVIVQRLADRAKVEGREDDNNIDTIRKRIQVFENDTGAVLEQYCIEKCPIKALQANKDYGAVRIGVKVWGDRPREETSKDFFAAYIQLTSTPIH